MGCHYKGIVVCVSAVTKSLYNTVALPPECLKFIILVTYAYLSFLYAVLVWKIFIILQVFVLSCKAQSLCLG